MRELQVLAEWLEVSESTEATAKAREALRRSQKKPRLYTYVDGIGSPLPTACSRLLQTCEVSDVEYIRITEKGDDAHTEAELKVYFSSTQDFATFPHPIEFCLANSETFPKLSVF